MSEQTTDTEAPRTGIDGKLIEQPRASNLFADLSVEQMQRLVRIGKVETHRTNQFIFREGDPGDTFYVVLDGAVRVSRQIPGMGEEALAVLRPGSGFGEMSLIEDSPRSADAIVHETCQLFIVGKQLLEDLMFVDRVMACDMLWKLVRILSKRLRETTDKLTFLSVTGKFE